MLQRLNSLRFKIRLAGLLVSVAGVLLVLVVLKWVLLPSYLELERQEVAERLTTLEAIIANEVTALDTLAHDWAAWDDTYRFVQNHNQEYLQSNLPVGTFRDNRLTLVAIINQQGTPVYIRAVDPKSGKDLPTAPLLADTRILKALRHLEHPEDKVTGLIPTPWGPMLVASRAIVDSRDRGPVRGALIFGRLFDAEMVGNLRQLVGGEFNVWMIQGAHPSISLDVKKWIKAGGNDLQVPVSSDLVWGFKLLHDITGAPLEILGLPYSRDIYQLGLRTMWIAVLVGVPGFLVIGSVAALWLQSNFLSPLEALTRHVQRVEETQDLAAYLAPRRNDEFGQLVKAFNALVARVRTLVTGSWQEIAERRQVEENLRTSEARYRDLSLEFQTLLHGIPDGLLLLSANGRIVWSNDGALRQLHGQGMFMSINSPEELMGQSFTIRPDSPVAQCLVSGSFADGIEKMPDGRIFGVKAFPLRSDDGSAMKVIRLANDVTDKIKFREESARTARLASLGELSAGIAHEINNPNGVVLMNVPILQRGFRDLLPLLDGVWGELGQVQVGGLPLDRFLAELPPLLQEIFDSARRIQRIVEDLKDFVRQDDSHLREAIDLNQVVEAAVRLTTNIIKRSTARFRFEPAPNLPKVSADFQQIEQVVVNLIQNACQALTDPQQAVTVSLAWLPETNVCRLQVADDGRGISPEARPHVFDPFFTTRRETGGTGLGLSVSMRIIRDHGGRFDFDSTPGQGSVFIVELPVAPTET